MTHKNTWLEEIGPRGSVLKETEDIMNLVSDIPQNLIFCAYSHIPRVILKERLLSYIYNEVRRLNISSEQWIISNNLFHSFFPNLIYIELNKYN